MLPCLPIEQQQQKKKTVQIYTLYTVKSLI